MSAPTGSSSKRSCRSAQSVVESDALIALEGAVGDGDGAIAMLGTGTAYHGAQGRRDRAPIGGWGFLVGDQGSGARIGRDLLEETLLAYDGIRQASPLTDAVLAVFRDDPRDVVEFTTTAKPGDFGGFAPMVFDHAAKGDAVAETYPRRAPSPTSRSRSTCSISAPAIRSACSAGWRRSMRRACPRAYRALLQAAAAGCAGRRRADGGAPVRRQQAKAASHG